MLHRPRTSADPAHVLRLGVANSLLVCRQYRRRTMQPRTCVPRTSRRHPATAAYRRSARRHAPARAHDPHCPWRRAPEASRGAASATSRRAPRCSGAVRTARARSMRNMAALARTKVAAARCDHGPRSHSLRRARLFDPEPVHYVHARHWQARRRREIRRGVRVRVQRPGVGSPRPLGEACAEVIEATHVLAGRLGEYVRAGDRRVD